MGGGEAPLPSGMHLGGFGVPRLCLPMGAPPVGSPAGTGFHSEHMDVESPDTLVPGKAQVPHK